MNKNFLAPREPSTNKLEIASSETTDTNQLIQIEIFLTKSLCDLEISEDWRKVIYEFSANNDIIIDSEFWNVGELKKGISIIPSYLGGGSSLNGTDDEINRYEEIEDLYYSIIEYNEYIDYFCEIDTYKKLDLVLSNIGDTFDEDIDIKICVAKILIIQLNLAILNEFIDNKSPFYDYLLNIDHFLWQGLIGGAIALLHFKILLFQNTQLSLMFYPTIL